MNPVPGLLALAFSVLICSASSNEHMLSKQEAIQKVQLQFERDREFGPIDITSVQFKDGYYEIIWSRQSNCEGGKVKIDAKTGETEGTHHIC